ncbi:Uncharacterised protein [Ectopseudomonas mendocina]|uniref:Uncharacterized protein n=1 Tax=Ectopseudomonas mendocina TaxID=300 RepID=A0A379PPY8_ECTME|nr:hypothetical protein [Pseudomonas mendocina]SUE95904.1 Uncharacterised protein [Pseudomonas mendocina]
MSKAIEKWLAPLDQLSHLECDGMTRVISHLLDENGVDHCICSGLLTDLEKLYDSAVPGAEHVAVTHWWVELYDGHYIDFRARMWMGDLAPHGVFQPKFGRFEYRVIDKQNRLSRLPVEILSLMSGVNLKEWPPLSQS